MTHEPVVNIWGELVALGPLRRDLVATYHRWVNDFEVAGPLGLHCQPYTLESEELRYDSITKDGSTTITFTIYERATFLPTGIAELQDVDQRHGTAEFGMFIGRKQTWSHGFGSETTRLLMDYAFRTLGLQNLMLKVFSHNERAIQVYQRAGFREIGRRREAFRHGNQVHDVIYMDCLASEHFRSNVAGP